MVEKIEKASRAGRETLWVKNALGTLNFSSVCFSKRKESGTDRGLLGLGVAKIYLARFYLFTGSVPKRCIAA